MPDRFTDVERRQPESVIPMAAFDRVCSGIPELDDGPDGAGCTDDVNVLLFNGERIISPDQLQTTDVHSQYKADGKLHEQERDVSKLYADGNVTISLFGMENQSRAEKFMPVRIIGYDGASYRQQLLEKNVTNVYPVVTMVLYFGDTHWQHSRHLIELIKKLQNR